jgi:hypothetical protein
MLLSLVYLDCHPRPYTPSPDRRFRPGRKGLPSFQSVSPVLLHSRPIAAACCFKSFSCNTYVSPRKCCKQRTYGLAKSFRCNTYKKQGCTPRRSDVQTCRRSGVFPPVPLQDAAHGATIGNGTRYTNGRGKHIAPSRCLRIMSGHREQFDYVPDQRPRFGRGRKSCLGPPF